MLRTKIKYENKQWAITKKLSKQELWFMCTALPLDNKKAFSPFLKIFSTCHCQKSSFELRYYILSRVSTGFHGWGLNSDKNMIQNELIIWRKFLRKNLGIIWWEKKKTF